MISWKGLPPAAHAPSPPFAPASESASRAAIRARHASAARTRRARRLAQALRGRRRVPRRAATATRRNRLGPGNHLFRNGILRSQRDKGRELHGAALRRRDLLVRRRRGDPGPGAAHNSSKARQGRSDICHALARGPHLRPARVALFVWARQRRVRPADRDLRPRGSEGVRARFSPTHAKSSGGAARLPRACRRAAAAAAGVPCARGVLHCCLCVGGGASTA